MGVLRLWISMALLWCDREPQVPAAVGEVRAAVKGLFAQQHQPGGTVALARVHCEVGSFASCAIKQFAGQRFS